MPQAVKKTGISDLLPGADDGDVLHFLTRTLQAHLLDAEPRDVLAKLRNLKAALDRQEATLLEWPDSTSKNRICEALAKAKRLVAQILDEYAATRGTPSVFGIPKRFDAITSSLQRSFKQ
jgi:hypothetical protein